jgi:hypothetical protein
MNFTWKPNWTETRQRLLDWWDHTGLILNAGGPPLLVPPHEAAPFYDKLADITRYYTDPQFHAGVEHFRLANAYLGGDILPIASSDMGPGSLALYLGSEPGFSVDTVWFNPCDCPLDREIIFDPENRWWQITQATLQACVEKSKGKYMVGCPDLIENVDILASLLGAENMLLELIELPALVLDRLKEINQAWFQVYSLIYNLIHLEDGSSAWGAFSLWGPGKTAKLQCDAAAMLSPKMFRKFVAPFLSEQCQWLDNSMFHLDGHQCICHLDALLEIEELDAIEWTADPVVPSGGDPTWYPMIKRILAAGKSVQIVDVKAGDVEPLLDSVGPKGLYLHVNIANQKEYEAVLATGDKFRS